MKIDELSQLLDTIINRDVIAGYDRVWAALFKHTEEFGWCGGTLRPADGGLMYKAANGEEQFVKPTDSVTVLLRFPDVKSQYDRSWKDVFFQKRLIVLLEEVRVESSPGIIPEEALRAVSLLAEIKALLE